MGSLKLKVVDRQWYEFKKKNIYLIDRKLTLPTGIKANLDVILHPGAVLIVPFLNANQIVMLKQFRPAVMKYLYEFPAGTINPKEKPLECAKRELMEEAGYRATVFKKLGSIHPVPGYSNEEIFIYQAQRLKPQKEAGDIDEVIEPVILSCSETKQLFKSGKIQDAKTIAGLAMSGLI